MKEKLIKIKIPSTKKVIYTKFHEKHKAPLFIILHGLPGNMDEYFYRKSCEWFAAQGFATARVNLYYWPKDSRGLKECSLKLHGKDLDLVVSYFKKQGYKKIFIAGHSFGGASILHSKEQKFTASALWDPSYKSNFKEGIYSGIYLKSINGYVMPWGIEVILGKKMVMESVRLNWDKLGTKFKLPTIILCAGKGILKNGCKAYYANLSSRKKLVIIPKAKHYFDDLPNMENQVYKKSYDWFCKFI